MADEADLAVFTMLAKAYLKSHEEDSPPKRAKKEDKAREKFLEAAATFYDGLAADKEVHYRLTLPQCCQKAKCIGFNGPFSSGIEAEEDADEDDICCVESLSAMKWLTFRESGGGGDDGDGEDEDKD